MITKYAGPWTKKEAAHLLRRTTFGLSRERIQEMVDLGLEGAVDYLLRDLPQPIPPINQYINNDPFVAIGDTWVDKPFASNAMRKTSFYAWLVSIMIHEGNHIREKLTLFWHNHFVVSDFNDARYMYRYSATIRQHALGNFGDFVKAITIDPGMLQYLNGRDNKASAPNENYARELLELFTVGKGELAGPGDYTTFTELDVAEMARSLTGWQDRGDGSTDIAEVYAAYNSVLHDKSPKQLSHRFNNEIISDGDKDEYKRLIDIILQSPYVGIHLAERVLRFFVHYELTDEVKGDLVEPLGLLFMQNNYDIKPVLMALFTSEYFYRDCYLGSMIRNPLDFIINTVVTLPTKLGRTEKDLFDYYANIAEFSELLQMELYNHQEVAGWKPYYQGPGYYRLWINSVTLPIRGSITDELVRGDDLLITGIDIMGYVNSQPNPYDINELITDMTYLLFVKPLTTAQIEYLKGLVIPGLPDFEWTVEYTTYRNEPENFPVLWSVRQKIQNLLIAALRMPEFYLS